MIVYNMKINYVGLGFIEEENIALKPVEVSVIVQVIRFKSLKYSPMFKKIASFAYCIRFLLLKLKMADHLFI